jgi:hypothetical protein
MNFTKSASPKESVEQPIGLSLKVRPIDQFSRNSKRLTSSGTDFVSVRGDRSMDLMFTLLRQFSTIEEWTAVNENFRDSVVL